MAGSSDDIAPACSPVLIEALLAELYDATLAESPTRRHNARQQLPRCLTGGSTACSTADDHPDRAIDRDPVGCSFPENPRPQVPPTDPRAMRIRHPVRDASSTSRWGGPPRHGGVGAGR